MDKVKILFLTADPSDFTRLRLGQELRDVREKLRLAKERDRFVLDSRESIRPGDITQAIFDVEPQIVHFSGHGMSTGELCFEDITGRRKAVQPDALANLFELVATQVNCVVLNACYSAIQAEAIVRHIPFVVGMNKAIGDQAAITFAVGFYKALGAGHSFENAYKFAQVEIQLQDIPESLTPVLHTKEASKKEENPVSIEGANPARIESSDLLYFRVSGTPYAYEVPGHLELVSIGRQRRKSNYSVNEGNDVVIRVADSDHCLRISRRHLEVKRTGSEYFVIDKSGGKTKLNGKVLQTNEFYTLKTKDILQIADVLELEVLIQTKAENVSKNSIIEIHQSDEFKPNIFIEASIGDIVTVNE